MNFKRLSFEDILTEERLREYNDCHTPGGPGGGQFCSGGGGEGGGGGGKGGGGGEPVTPFFKALRADRKKGELATPDKIGTLRTGAGVKNLPSDAQKSTVRSGPKKAKFEFAAAGEAHMGTYQGMKVHTLPGYVTPYYYVDAPGFGSFEHTPHLGTIKRQINAFKTTGETPSAARKRKGSERYQRRKARGG